MQPSEREIEREDSSSSSGTRWVMQVNEWMKTDEDFCCARGARGRTGEIIAESVQNLPGASHENGTCEPCVFSSSSGGCPKGSACGYCHLPHPNVTKFKRSGLRKKPRERIRERIRHLLAQNDLLSRHEELQRECQKSPYARSLIHRSIERGMFSDPYDSDP
eukprot:symbB.v1.2.026427.t1/scaffold2637.1/size74321/3